jgi:pyrroline-5-carboxylate reductase
LSNRDATYLVTRVYHGMLQDAARELDLDRLIAEQTPGGLNEQALANAESLGITNIHNTIQDAMFRRIVGETDGSL